MRFATGRMAALVLILLLSGLGVLAVEPGEEPALGLVRVTQPDIESGALSRDEIRMAGLRMFTTLFNRHDGYGDGPINPADTTSPGGRPTLQGNGTLLRINGLDAQGCIECHAIISAATVPPRLGIGGVGGANTNAIIMPTAIDVVDTDLDGAAGFNGRFANPPFLFGSGAVELLAREMTVELFAQRDAALANPGAPVQLTSKGISFGTIVADLGGTLDTSGVEGVDHDLIVRPFGRKGEFRSIRDFDIGAMEFHFGMQPVEKVGEGIDGDGDGVSDEILVGELTALSVFLSTLERPQFEFGPGVAEGFELFNDLGCAGCHIPLMSADRSVLPLQFPEEPADMDANVVYEVNLRSAPVRFPGNGAGGILVPLFADLKRHDMGDDLAESFGGAISDREFTTARLWGIADTAPYLHDGRATTLTDAILMHGGEAQEERDAFAGLDDTGRRSLLTFLRALRTPENPAADLTRRRDRKDRPGPIHDVDQLPGLTAPRGGAPLEFGKR